MDQSCWHLSLSQVLFLLIPIFSSELLISGYLFLFSHTRLVSLLFLHFLFSLSLTSSNGRAVHYNGSSLLQWKSVRLDVTLLPGEMEHLSTLISKVNLSFHCFLWLATKNVGMY